MFAPELTDEDGNQIRLRSPRLKTAMLEVGVTKKNLMLRSKESFFKSGKEKVMPAIAEKRYQVAVNLRDENVRRVLEARTRLICEQDRKDAFRAQYSASAGSPGAVLTPRDETEKKLREERKRIDRQLQAAKQKADEEQEMRKQLELQTQVELKENVSIFNHTSAFAALRTNDRSHADSLYEFCIRLVNQWHNICITRR